MEMSFHNQLGFTFLFRNVTVKTQAGLVAVAMAVFAFAIANQSLAAYHSFCAFIIRMKVRQSKLHLHGIDKMRRKRILRHVVSTLTYVFQTASAYLLMLAVSTYNSGIIFAATLGIGVGYLITQPLILQRMDIAYLKQEEKKESLIISFSPDRYEITERLITSL